MRVSVLQLAYGDEEGVAERTARVAALVAEQAGADLVILPELWPQGGFAYRHWEQEAQPLDGSVVSAMKAVARDIGGVLHMGSIVERDAAGQLFNTSLLLGPDGGVLATYRKIHLFGFSDGEPKLMTAGSDLVVHDPFGLAMCYDLRFPELFRGLLDRGAQVLRDLGGGGIGDDRRRLGQVGGLVPAGDARAVAEAPDLVGEPG